MPDALFIYVGIIQQFDPISWWRHQMETFSTLLALCDGNSPVAGEFPFIKASDAELQCFHWSAPEQTVE